jgi:hypothetical protein
MPDFLHELQPDLQPESLPLPQPLDLALFDSHCQLVCKVV